MDRRSFLRAGAGAAGALALAGCRPIQDGRTAISDPGEPSVRPTLRLPISGDFGFPNPLAYLPPAYIFVSYIFDTLLWTDATDTAKPWLAKTYERSADGRQYTFHLRDNVKWHDGQPLSADDVAFSFNYFKAQELKLPPYVIFRPENVVQAKAVDPATVVISLSRPAVTFPTAVAATFPIVPAHIWSSMQNPAAVTNPAKLVGSGPYRLEKYSSSQGSYLLTANDQFFLGKPFVKRLEFSQVGDQLTALLAGDADAGGFGINGATPLALWPFRDRQEFGVIKGHPDFTAALYFNLKSGGALNDVSFRRAVALAIDRKDMTSRLFGSMAEPGNPGFLPPRHPFGVKVEQYEFNRKAAEALLDKAGYARGPDGVRVGPGAKPLRFKLLAVPQLAPVTELVQIALKSIGVAVEIEPVEFFQAFQSLSGGNYDMAMIFYGGIGGDPDYMRGVYSSKFDPKGFLSVHGYKDDEFDRLAEAQLGTFDEAERKTMVARMQQIVARDVPLIHIYYPVPFLVYRRTAFDQWTYGRAGGGPLNKRLMVTGLKQGLDVRPIKGE
ncbi:MAG: ABC transporter substrate-binding protein [Actinomycetota bacterium]